jgi:ADP-ribose pyrophosphatase
MIPLRIGPRRLVYQNLYQQIYSVSAEFETFTKEIFISDYGQRAGLLYIRGDEVLLVRQYRMLVHQLAWEIPGGKVDHGEDPEDAAIREGLEEARLRCHSLRPLLHLHPGLDTCDNPTFVFYTDDFEEAYPDSRNLSEVCERVWVPLDQCLKMIFTARIVDSLTIAALLAYHTRKHHPELFT